MPSLNILLDLNKSFCFSQALEVYMCVYLTPPPPSPTPSFRHYCLKMTNGSRFVHVASSKNKYHKLSTYRNVIFIQITNRDYVNPAHYTYVTFIDILNTQVHCKKRLMTFLSPAGMSPTKLSLAGNNLIFPGQGELGLVTGKMANLFFTVYCLVMNEVVLSESRCFIITKYI